MPTISHLHCNAGMTWLAEGHEVSFVIRAAMTERQDVMHFGRYRQLTFTLAQLTERMQVQESCTYLSPCIAIPSLGCRVSAILLILLACQMFMLRTVPCIRQFWTAGITAWLLWTSWHTIHLHFRHAKSPRGIAPRGLVLYPFLVEYIISQQLD